jgi:type IV pilus assembly protein PilO
VADMLRRIQTLATQSSLVVKVFRPQAVVSKTLHQEWPMTLELDGTYHDLARFFDHVSKVPRIINVGAIAIKGKPTKDTVDGTTITAQCTATTFVLLDKPTAAAGRKPGTIQRPGAPAKAPAAQ